MEKRTLLDYGKYYHIYNRGNDGENIFVEARNYPYFLRLYAKYVEPVAETFAYCLLRNHFHMLVRIRTVEEQRQTSKVLKTFEVFTPLDPTRQFGNLFNSYAKAINKAYGRTGSLFETSFGRIEVTSERYFTTLVHYIHFNPQKHGFVADFRDYAYSSYPSLLSHKPTRLNRDQVLDWFNGRDRFIAFHEATADERPISALIREDFD